MANFKDLANSLKATVNDVLDSAKDLASTAGDKAKVLSRRAKIMMEMNAEKENLEKAYTEIGKLYYEMNANEPGEFFVQLFDQVKFAAEHISAMEEELASLKAEDEEDLCDFDAVVAADEAPAAESCCCTEAAVEAGIEVEITVEETTDAEPEHPAE